MGKKIIFVLTSLLFVSLLFSDEQYKDNQKIEITGLVRLTGAEPFTRISIRYDKIDFLLPDDTKKTFTQLMNKAVTVRGTVRIAVLESADGKYKVREYHLDKVKIVKK
jgi:hypothetical protein